MQCTSPAARSVGELHWSTPVLSAFRCKYRFWGDANSFSYVYLKTFLLKNLANNSHKG